MLTTGPKRLSNMQSLQHSARTAVAAVVSLAAARLFRLPEAYWAAVTTLIVMQSTLGAAVTVSARRFIGTVLGASLGALLATLFGTNIVAFGVGIFVLGVLCAWLAKLNPKLPEYLERSTYRFGGIALVIVMLVVRYNSPWVAALHRIAEIAIGILAGLVMTLIWPERAEGV